MAQSTATFTVEGIDSEDDSQAIADELAEVDGVMGIDIDPESGEAAVKYDEDVLAGERVKITVRELGYDVE